MILHKADNKKKPSSTDKKIQDLREKIKQIDKSLVTLIAKRMNLTDQIGRHKKLVGYPVRNITLEKAMFTERATWGKQLKINPGLVRQIFRLLISHSVTRQKKIIRG
jgi:chorismate mutase/prephenate dehydrogenase